MKTHYTFKFAPELVRSTSRGVKFGTSAAATSKGDGPESGLPADDILAALPAPSPCRFADTFEFLLICQFKLFVQDIPTNIFKFI